MFSYTLIVDNELLKHSKSQFIVVLDTNDGFTKDQIRNSVSILLQNLCGEIAYRRGASSILKDIWGATFSKMGKQLVLLGIIPFQKNVKKNSLKVSFFRQKSIGFYFFKLDTP